MIFVFFLIEFLGKIFILYLWFELCLSRKVVCIFFIILWRKFKKKDKIVFFLDYKKNGI